MNKENNLQKSIFYLLDKGIRSYRQFAQQRVQSFGYDITIDQWLVLNTLEANPDLSQAEIAEIVFKDTASLTRIIDLMVNKGYIERSISNEDRRRFHLQITKSGKQLLENVSEVVYENRRLALNGISDNEIEMLSETLKKLITNSTSALIVKP